jgi:RNA polymerase sigma factor (sigma-70 family)
MSQQLVPDSATPSDPELIAAVRGGDSQAYGELFERHRRAALSLARQIAGPSDADDLVSDAFMKVHRVLATGGGPDVAFRAYLLTAVRRLHVDRIRATKRVTPSDDLEQFDPGTPFKDSAVDNFENAAAAKAFASLPERWQLVLWHLEVEGQKPAEIAPLLGMSANSVSALAYRAREGLRQAYLQMHLADTAGENCRWVTERLGAHVRKGLSRRDAAKVDEHLDECSKCAAVYLELSEVNSNLSGIIAPALLGTAAAGYLASASGGMSLGGAAGLFFGARQFAKAHSLMTAGGVAGGVVAASVATVFVTQVFTKDTNDTDPRANVPAIGAPATTSGPTQAPTTPDPTTPPTRTPTGPTQQPPVLIAPTVPRPSTAPPTQGPAVIVVGGQIPNPQDDDAPAPNDTDDPGIPPVTIPPTEPPSAVDVTLSIDANPRGRRVYRIVLDTDTAEPATSLSMVLSFSATRAVALRGWACSASADPAADFDCVTESADPADLRINAVFPRRSTPTLTATVTAVGYDEDPDSLGNNTVSWAGPPIHRALAAAKPD